MDIPKFGWMDRQCRPFRCRVRSVLSVAIGAFSVCPESIPVDRPILLIAMAFYTVINFIMNKFYTFKA